MYTIKAMATKHVVFFGDWETNRISGSNSLTIMYCSSPFVILSGISSNVKIIQVRLKEPKVHGGTQTRVT